MIITDENTVIQALANVRLESMSVSLELQAQLNAPASERLTTGQLLAMLRVRSARSSTLKNK